MASAGWAQLSCDQRRKYKAMARENRGKQGNDSRSSTISRFLNEFDAQDDLSLLENLAKKRVEDVTSLTQRWDWRYPSDGKSKFDDAKHVFVSAQCYIQQSGSSMAPTLYLPAELFIVEWSLNEDFKEFHETFPPCFYNISDVAAVDDDAATTHGITSQAYRQLDNRLFATTWEETVAFVAELKRHPVFCFKRELTECLGVLQYISIRKRRNGQPFFSHPYTQLVCIEDFVLALCKRIGIECPADVGTDLAGFIERFYADYATDQCELHASMTARHLSGSSDTFRCSQALLKGALIFIRKWFAEKKVSTVMKMFQRQSAVDGGKSESATVRHSWMGGPPQSSGKPVISQVMPQSIADESEAYDGADVVTLPSSTDENFAPSRKLVCSSRSDTTTLKSDDPIVQAEALRLAEIRRLYGDHRKTRPLVPQKFLQRNLHKQMPKSQQQSIVSKEHLNAVTPTAVPVKDECRFVPPDELSTDEEELSRLSRVPTPEPTVVVVAEPVVAPPVSNGRSQMVESETTPCASSNTDTVHNGTFTWPFRESERLVLGQDGRPVLVCGKAIAEATSFDFAQCLPVGYRGLGRGMCLWDPDDLVKCFTSANVKPVFA